MYLVGALLIFLAIKKKYEPTLFFFMGFGAMMDFTPLLQRPIYFLFGFATQAGIFVAMGIAMFVRKEPLLVLQ